MISLSLYSESCTRAAATSSEITRPIDSAMVIAVDFGNNDISKAQNSCLAFDLLLYAMNCYKILDIPNTSSSDEIRKAYIKQSLIYHPDRNPSSDSKLHFQEIANAYYILSDPTRKKEYDTSAKLSSGNVDPVAVFTSVVDDLLIPEVPNPIWFWQPIAAICGIIMGFIIFNIPGALIGYYFGSKMGKVRDMKGVCVYEAFTQLPMEKRAQILTDIGKKMFQGAIMWNVKIPTKLATQ